MLVFLVLPVSVLCFYVSVVLNNVLLYLPQSSAMDIHVAHVLPRKSFSVRAESYTNHLNLISNGNTR